MPELRFTIQWPDGVRETCYSPSTIVRDHFTPHAEYAVAEFVDRSRAALTAASERVKVQYGHPCSLALGQLARIEAAAARFPETAQVLFVSFKD
jgi:uncharacterized repeat protein (TIGR04042 family)